MWEPEFLVAEGIYHLRSQDSKLALVWLEEEVEVLDIRDQRILDSKSVLEVVGGGGEGVLGG